VRVVRFIGAFAGGRILNARTARSQYIGGMVWGIGMALLEQTHVDPRTGRVMSPDLEHYLLPVNADVPAMEAYLVEERDDAINPLGAKGIGEIGIVGAAAAIANAVYHATGRRVRDLPITCDKLL
jgi:xanthine dehydrogenase YagR molybdenum-binding subunit